MADNIDDPRLRWRQMLVGERTLAPHLDSIDRPQELDVAAKGL